MTIISVEYPDIVHLLGKRYSFEDIRSKLSMIGAADEGMEGETISFDVSPNRPDMYTVEGLVRALRGAFGLEVGFREFPVAESNLKFRIDSSVEQVRPYAVGAIVRNLKMAEGLLTSLMDMQEKLHATIGRRRKKVAIGIHDYDKVKGPFKYHAVEPKSVKFVPLAMDKGLTLEGILKEHEKGREYAHILKGYAVYPIIEDSEGTVLSFPPIINGIVTALTEETSNVFIDVTGLDKGAVNSVLNIIATSLFERGGKLESIELETPKGNVRTPDLSPSAKTVSISTANSLLGLSFTPEEAARSLDKMRFGTSVFGDQIEIRIPPYRVDILHVVDLIEDIAIGYGYDRVTTTLAHQSTIGSASDVTVFSQMLKELMVGYGYQEIMSLSMVDPEMPFKGGTAGPKIVNPVSIELSALRSSLLPSLLRILSLNKHRDLPQRIFEVEDILKNGLNERHLAGASIHSKASFTEIKSLVQSLFRDLGQEFNLDTVDENNFIPGRCAVLRTREKEIGIFGEITPAILDAYGLMHPVCAFELNTKLLRKK